MINRRRYLQISAGAAVAAATPFARGRELPAAVAESDLIYLTPIRSDGTESRCQAEIWFVHDRGDLVVVTASDAWRARAVERGLQSTRIWIGDVGEWNSKARYKKLPVVMANASIDRDPATHTRVLGRFGEKYPLQWMLWGPKFENGLTDGSRVMLRYHLS